MTDFEKAREKQIEKVMKISAASREGLQDNYKEPTIESAYRAGANWAHKWVSDKGVGHLLGWMKDISRRREETTEVKEIKHIDRPDWKYEILPVGLQDDVFPKDKPKELRNYISPTVECLNKWFDEHVAPLNKLLDEAKQLAHILSMSKSRSLDWDQMNKEGSLRILQDWRGKCFKAITRWQEYLKGEK